MPTNLVLASQSPARLALLRAAGIEPAVVVSEVDEEALIEELGPVEVEALVSALARAKALDVAARVDDTLVIGCDSMFTIDGQVWGKPSGPAEAIARIGAMQGRAGVLHTGHHLVHAATGEGTTAVASTVVRFGPMSDHEIAAYVATGEPLRVAGSFTLDGRSAPFIDGIEGDHTNVVGLSLPLLRTMLAELGISVVELWA